MKTVQIIVAVSMQYNIDTDQDDVAIEQAKERARQDASEHAGPISYVEVVDIE